MAKLQIVKNMLLLPRFLMCIFSLTLLVFICSRCWRSYAVAAGGLNMKPAGMVGVMRKAADDDSAEDDVHKVFWMKDPKTGNWIPETHFGQVDVAEMRDKLLSKKPKFST